MSDESRDDDALTIVLGEDGQPRFANQDELRVALLDRLGARILRQRARISELEAAAMSATEKLMRCSQCGELQVDDCSTFCNGCENSDARELERLEATTREQAATNGKLLSALRWIVNSSHCACPWPGPADMGNCPRCTAREALGLSKGGSDAE